MCPSIRPKLTNSIVAIAFVLACLGFSRTVHATDPAARWNGVFPPQTPLAIYANIAFDWTQGIAPASPDCVVWDVVPSPNAGTTNDQLLSVTTISANDVWAAGWYVAG